MTAGLARRDRTDGRGSPSARARVGAVALTVVAALAALAPTACETGVKPTATIAAADSADQVLLSMSHFVTDNGIQRSHVRADTAYFYSASQTAELRNVHITFYDPRGAQTSVLTAHEGTYRWRTGDMEARGNVVVVRTDGATLRTEVLRYSQVRNQVSSDRPFVFDEPTRHIKGDGFTSDPDFKVVTATHPTGVGGKFTLPNQ